MLDIESAPPLLRRRLEEVLSRHAQASDTSLPGGHLLISPLDPIAQAGPQFRDIIFQICNNGERRGKLDVRGAGERILRSRMMSTSPFCLLFFRFLHELQCGLVALSMASQLLGLKRLEVCDIFKMAEKLGFTAQGEIFSADWLRELACTLFPVEAEVLELPNPNKMIGLMLSGCAVLVPYDCDKNHEPALRNGHGAHWAILVGFLIVDVNLESLQSASSDVVVTNDGTFYVFAYHGKSKHIALWSYSDLRQSCNQLYEAGPKRQHPDFVIPQDGLTHLRGKCVCLRNIRTDP
ncbi:hypothetical protein Y032_0009g484 [Ancylostoma ceylanicum]|uniref:Actin maturation protease n=1 Tax=Ancylostoma ceylanicum TaxID=53326 RepID=A0A016VJ67_9BILA|nr:hypothetical protein Y032_0009g484 [Ancylostoma ceylanicum]